jgi:DNA repair protein RadC
MKKLKDLSESDRPREKLQARGPEALSDLELLAILLGSGTRDIFNQKGYYSFLEMGLL